MSEVTISADEVLKLVSLCNALTKERAHYDGELLAALQWMYGTGDEIGLLATVDGYYEWGKDPRYDRFAALLETMTAQESGT